MWGGGGGGSWLEGSGGIGRKLLHAATVKRGISLGLGFRVSNVLGCVTVLGRGSWCLGRFQGLEGLGSSVLGENVGCRLRGL